MVGPIIDAYRPQSRHGYSEMQMAAFGEFVAEVRSLLEVTSGMRAKRIVAAYPHTLRHAWQCGVNPAQVAADIRRTFDHE